MEPFQWVDVEGEHYRLRIIFKIDLHIKEFHVIFGRPVSLKRWAWHMKSFEYLDRGLRLVKIDKVLSPKF